MKAVYNGRLITKMESDRIRKSEKEQFGGPIDTGDDTTAVATSVVTTRLKGTEVGKSIDQDFKQLETGFKGADDDMLSRRPKKRDHVNMEDEDGDEDGDAKSSRVGVGLWSKE